MLLLQIELETLKRTERECREPEHDQLEAIEFDHRSFGTM